MFFLIGDDGDDCMDAATEDEASSAVCAATVVGVLFVLVNESILGYESDRVGGWVRVRRVGVFD